MKLTSRQREILEGLASDDDEMDLIQDGREAWFGGSRTNGNMIMFFLDRVLISQHETSPGVYRYEINEWGRRVLRDPDFEPKAELFKLDSHQRAKGVLDEKEQKQPWPTAQA